MEERAVTSSPAARPETKFWLLFNAYGEIGYCSDPLAALLGRNAAEVKGRCVTSILSKMPLNRKTPGSNMGALMMSYVGQAWPLELLVGDGRRLPVHASVHMVRVGGGPAFIVELGLREQPAAPGADA